MDARKRAPERREVAASPHVQILEHQEGLVAPLSAAQRGRDARAGVGERREAVGLRREIVELRALVDLREILAAAALEHEAAVDAAAVCRRRSLDVESPCRLRDGGLQRGEKPRRDQVRLSAARARLIAART